MASNVKIMNSIIQNSPVLRAQLPQVTEMNIREVTGTITGNQALSNEFYTEVSNKLLLQKVIMQGDMSHPLAKTMKIDRFQYGDSISMVATNLLRVYDYHALNDSSNLGNVFEQFRPEVVEYVYSINKKSFIPLTTNIQELNLIVTREGGVQSWLTALMQSLTNTKYVDEFESAKKLVSYTYLGGTIARQETDTVTDQASAESLTIKLRKAYMDFQEAQDTYSGNGFTVITNEDDIMLIINTSIMAIQDVTVLAKAFNMSKTDFLGRIIVLSKPVYGLEHVQALMYDKRRFFIIDNVLPMQMVVENGRYLSKTIYLHYWQTYGSFVVPNALCFVDDLQNDDTVTAVSITNSESTVTHGTPLKLTATVTGDTTNDVYWIIPNSFDSQIYVTEDGTLHVYDKENVGKVVKVKAISKKNISKFAEKDFTVA